MLVKLKTAMGTTEFFETQDFNVAKDENVNPDILEFTIFSNRGRRLYHWKRRNIKGYLKTYIPKEQRENSVNLKLS